MGLIFLPERLYVRPGPGHVAPLDGVHDAAVEDYVHEEEDQVDVYAEQGVPRVGARFGVARNGLKSFGKCIFS